MYERRVRMVVDSLQSLLHLDPSLAEVDVDDVPESLPVIGEQLVVFACLELLRRERVAVDGALSTALRRCSRDELQSGDDRAFVDEIILVNDIALPVELPPGDLVLAAV